MATHHCARRHDRSRATQEPGARLCRCPGRNQFGYIDQITGVFIISGLNQGSNVDGMKPRTLVQTEDGNFYGVTENGGEYGWGSLFRFHPGDEVPVFNFEPKLEFSVKRNTIVLGASLDFSWRGQKVTDCQASSNESGGSAWSGARDNSATESYTTSQLGNWTYTLTCQSENGPLAQSIKAEIVPVQAEPDIIKEGGGAWGKELLLLLPLAVWYRNDAHDPPRKTGNAEPCIIRHK